MKTACFFFVSGAGWGGGGEGVAVRYPCRLAGLLNVGNTTTVAVI